MPGTAENQKATLFNVALCSVALLRGREPALSEAEGAPVPHNLKPSRTGSR